MEKSIFKSKTFWFNLAMAVMAMFPSVRDKVTPEVFGMVWGVVSMGLRLVTKDKVVLLP